MALKVLIVDDEPDVRLVLKIQLEGAGFEVVAVAADGGEAVEQCAKVEPDLVVMDLLMPGVSGFEAITRIRAEQPGVGIVAYTGVAGEFVRDEMDRLGVTLVLKSGDPQPLIGALHQAAADRG